jgi:hypothetical protein
MPLDDCLTIEQTERARDAVSIVGSGTGITCRTLTAISTATLGCAVEKHLGIDLLFEVDADKYHVFADFQPQDDHDTWNASFEYVWIHGKKDIKLKISIVNVPILVVYKVLGTMALMEGCEMQANHSK